MSVPLSQFNPFPVTTLRLQSSTERGINHMAQVAACCACSFGRSLRRLGIGNGRADGRVTCGIMCIMCLCRGGDDDVFGGRAAVAATERDAASRAR